MKVKLAFIGNSSSASYYVRQVPQPAQTSGELGNTGLLSEYWLDRVYKWDGSTVWGQQAVADILFKGSANIDEASSGNSYLTGFQCNVGFAVTNGSHEAAGYTSASFPTDTDIQKQYTLTFGTPVGTVTSGTFNCYVGGTVAGLTGPIVVSGSTADRTNFPGLLSGENSVCCYWNHVTKNLRIYAQHKTPCDGTSATAMIIKSVKLNYATKP